MALPGGVDAFPELTDDSFTPEVIAICSAPGAADGGYGEIEVSSGVGAGVPAGLGSLDAALTGIGSSGSVAQTAGSPGS